MIEIYKKINGKLKLYGKYENYDFLYPYKQIFILELFDFPYGKEDNCEAFKEFTAEYKYYYGMRGVYVVYDAYRGKYVSPMELVNIQLENEIYYKRKRKQYGYKWAKPSFRHMKTTQERRYNCKTYEEFEPPIRGKRKNLPCTWCDYWTHNDKSWKTQSKKRKQWM